MTDPTLPDRLTRTVDLYGRDAVARLRTGTAVVVGLGGVGAHAAVALARTGVGRLHLIDPDRVTTSSLNRHPVAGPADVGQSKAEVLATALARACPDVGVTPVTGRVTATSQQELLPAASEAGPLVLVDAIDRVPDKVALLAHAVARRWPAVCSLGAAGKRDPGAVRTGSLAASRVCPLGRVVRRGLRAAGVDPGGIGAVWSEEPALGPVGEPPPRARPGEPMPRRRQPSNLMLPGILGYALAALAVERLLGGPADGPPDAT